MTLEELEMLIAARLDALEASDARHDRRIASLTDSDLSQHEGIRACLKMLEVQNLTLRVLLRDEYPEPKK